MDQDQQWLLNCLSATLDPNPEVRCFAEASLDQASRQPDKSDCGGWFVRCCACCLCGVVVAWE
ncbi:Armadillo-type fold [Vigna unguiculata]|uniref:Armadillo-type fold n=1 Tax=Vigna unguiculata TaxID=3917 RepID=A0A4D6LND5_VIGUN|nr:Armadillo-type fold [Vigna unguiculata]